ncbi:NUMOD1 domain-containing DNA-binding protein [Algoriphagus sp. D3-2-R+10]|uniref:NUMOD1 domain-containing DNA-binding protein n=1 Tax=Algoriphagus aurantiacus TaxID=3103948 RepID=UPI002B3B5AD3|nr:NUMOD1 domain-containing DNA-binding protein [Algoriphagus sp. D3-2-R+10]MEB2775220.1 NUMOD1 domain-containing DNA-binding protein [Algoriphagus sp. D3-2-R+10]
MNTEIYNYVNQHTKKIKNKEMIDDTIQDVLLIIIEKGLIDSELTPELKKIILGVIWNVSHSNFTNEERKYQQISEDFDVPDSIDSNTNSKSKLEAIFPKLRRHIINKYMKKGKDITPFKCWYLFYLGYSPKEISNRLDVTNEEASIKVRLVNKIIKTFVTGISSNQPLYQLNYYYKPIKLFNNVNEASKELGIKPNSIYQCLRSSRIRVKEINSTFIYKTEYDSGSYSKVIPKFEIYKNDNFIDVFYSLTDTANYFDYCIAWTKEKIDRNEDIKGYTVKYFY